MKREVFTTMFLPRFGAFLLILCSCQFALGATVNQEKEELASLQRNLNKQEQKLLSIKSDMQSLPTAIASAKDKAAKAETEYKAEKEEFDKLKTNHAASPTDSTERQLRLAEIKFGLAERRYTNAASELEELENSQKELEKSLAATEATISSTKTQINRQQQRVSDAVAAAEKQEAEAKKPAPKVAVAAPVIEPPKAQIKVEKPEPVAPPAPSPKQATASDAIALSKSDFDEFQFAKEKMSSTEALVAEASSDERPNFSELTLAGSNFDDIAFSYLGNQQYRTDVTLYSGRYSFRIESLRFRVEVPEDGSPHDFVFLVDARDKNQLRASYFRKALLDYVGKEVVVENAKPTPAPAPAVAPSIAKSPERTGVVETPDGILMSKEDFEEFQFAKEKMATTESLAAQDPNEPPFFSNLNLSNSKIGDVAFTHLGNQQYRADVALTSGRHSFRVDSLRFNIDVPASATPLEFIFLIDGRDKKQLRASYFRKVLLDYADKKVAVAP